MPVFYECQRCTACCRWPGQVRVTEAEIRRLAEFLGLEEFVFIQRYCRLAADRRGLVLEERPDGSCIFLEGRDCQVQAVKPQQCKDFPNWWRFPGFETQCQARPRDLDEEVYIEAVARATGRSREEIQQRLRAQAGAR